MKNSWHAIKLPRRFLVVVYSDPKRGTIDIVAYGYNPPRPGDIAVDPAAAPPADKVSGQSTALPRHIVRLLSNRAQRHVK